MEEGYYFVKHNKQDRLGFIIWEIAYCDGCFNWYKINDMWIYNEYDFREINYNKIEQ